MIDLERTKQELEQRAKERAEQREEANSALLGSIARSLEDISARLGTVTRVLTDIRDNGHRR